MTKHVEIGTNATMRTLGRAVPVRLGLTSEEERMRRSFSQILDVPLLFN